MCIRDRANNTDGYQTNVILPDLRNDLLCDDDEEIVQRIIKCPEITIKFNNDITVQALLDTGSVITGLSESWFNQNKQNIAPYEILPMTNTLIISVVGNKSKLIRSKYYVIFISKGLSMKMCIRDSPNPKVRVRYYIFVVNL